MVSLPADVAAVIRRCLFPWALSNATRSSLIKRPKFSLSDGRPGLSARPPKR